MSVVRRTLSLALVGLLPSTGLTARQTASTLTVPGEALTAERAAMTVADAVTACGDALATGLPGTGLVLGLDVGECDPATSGGGEASIELRGVFADPARFVVVMLEVGVLAAGSDAPADSVLVAMTVDGVEVWRMRASDLPRAPRGAAARIGTVVTTVRPTGQPTHQLTIRGPPTIALVIDDVQLTSRSLPASIKGLGYNPFRDCQLPGSAFAPTEVDVRADLAEMRNIATAIRTYSATGIVGRVPALANETGLPVYAGAWIDTVAVQDRLEVEALIRLAHTQRPAGLVVGNEFLHRHPSPEDAEYLADWIREVRSSVAGLGIPVGTAELIHDFVHLNDQEDSLRSDRLNILDQLDFVFLHDYPFWGGASIDSAVEGAVARFLRARAALLEQAPDLRVMLGETGWPSAGQRERGTGSGASAAGGFRPGPGALPSPTNQERYYREFLAAANREGIDFFYFAAQDELWKAEGQGGVGRTWGIARTDRSAKYRAHGMLLDAGETNAADPVSIDSIVLFDCPVGAVCIGDEWPARVSPESVDSTLPVQPDTMGVFIPSQYMGDQAAIAMFECEREHPRSGVLSIRSDLDLTHPLGWGGVAWVFRPTHASTEQKDWQGEPIDVRSLMQVTRSKPVKITFWARGARGGEFVNFGMTTRSGAAAEAGWLRLTPEWRQYTIDLRQRDLGRVTAAFWWMSNRDRNPGRRAIRFFLDDIRYESK
jgi:exo-beta-1,3-glucanase (GH17 family)